MCYLSAFLFGLVFGSFVNVCSWRIPKGQSVVAPRSTCRSCGKLIRWYDNIPIFSYFFLRGKCRECKSKISIEYPIVELITGIVFLMIYSRFRNETITTQAIFLFFALLLVILSVIDFHHRIIPDVLSYLMMAAGVLFSTFNSFLHESIPSWVKSAVIMPDFIINILFSIISLVTAGMVFYFIALTGEKLFKKEAMGGGDIKLIAAIGAYAGIINVFWIIFLSSLIGGISGLILIALGKKKRFDAIPFGPFISVAALLVVLLQPGLGRWYLAHFI